MASVWCIYCSATDTSEDPENEKSPLQHSKGQNYWFILLPVTQTGGEEHYLFDLLHRSEVQDDVADTFLLLAHRVNGETLKLDGSSL